SMCVCVCVRRVCVCAGMSRRCVRVYVRVCLQVCAGMVCVRWYGVCVCVHVCVCVCVCVHVCSTAYICAHSPPVYLPHHVTLFPTSTTCMTIVRVHLTHPCS